MPTTDKFAVFNDKNIIGPTMMEDYGFKYMRLRLADAVSKLVRTDAWLASVDINITQTDRISVDANKDGFVGGGVVNTSGDGALPSYFYSGLYFPNVNATVYSVHASIAEVPILAEHNVRASNYDFTRYEEFFGYQTTPDLVTDNGNGTITFRVNTACGASGTHANRKVRIWYTTPQTTTSSIVFETLTVAFVGGHNVATSVAAFGLAAVDTVAANWKVMLLGPRLTTAGGTGLFIGTVTGGGPGNAPSAKSTAAQVVYTVGLSGIGNVLRTDAHGSVKVQVDADATDADEPQIAVRDKDDVTVWKVDEDGDEDVGKATQATVTRTMLSSGGNVTIKNNAGRLEIADGTVSIKNIADALELDDSLTAAAIKLTTTAVPDARKWTVVTNALAATLRQGLVAAINDVYDIAGGTNYLIAGIAPLLQQASGQVTAGAGLTANIAQMNYYYLGVHYTKAASTFVMTDATTRFLYYDHSSDAFVETAAVTTLGSDGILLAKIVTAGGAISSITDLRHTTFASRLQTDILVGPEPNDGAHFTTVKAAVDFVRDYIRPGSPTQRTFKIRVIGPVTETAAVNIDFSGVSIEGDLGHRGEVAWSGDFHLFRVSTSNFTVRNLAIKAAHAGDDAGSVSRAAFYIEGVRSRVYLHNIFFWKSAGSSAHAFVYPDGTGELRDSSILDSDLTGASDHGIYLKAAQRLQIRGCRISQWDTLQVAGSPGSGVRLDGGNDNVIDGCVIENWDKHGVHLAGAVRTRIHNCYVYAVGDHGILIDSGADRTWCTNVVTTAAAVDVAAGGGSVGYGIHLKSGKKCKIFFCDLNVGGNADTKRGLRIDAANATDFAQFGGNQYNSLNVDNQNGANTTGNDPADRNDA